ncbi:MAG: hypothetical protein M3R00_10630 [Pseudomonadota bacterium]|nr:hypothetical protein [Pseudomonadota bacterium]
MKGKGMSGAGGGLVSALIGFGIMGAMALYNRNAENNGHEAGIRDYRNNGQANDIITAELRRAIDTLRGQTIRQADQIVRYQEICQRLRREYDLSQAEYSILNSEVIKLEREINRAQADCSESTGPSINKRRKI